MNNKTKSLVLSGAAVALATPMSSALALDDVLSFGAWVNYNYNVDDDASEDRFGDLDFESFNIYANHEHGDWFLDSEVRLGKGSFQGSGISEQGSEATADRNVIGIKELAIGRHYGEEWTMTIGKTTVPFTYSRFNFWPGARNMAGFDDQDGVGIRFDNDPVNTPFDMSLMFVKSQNFGNETTSLDDGQRTFWGTDDTYHVMNTLVGDFGFTTGDFRHGVSVQAGQLADQDDTDEIEGHYAAGLYSEGTVGALDLSAQFVHYDLDEVDGDVTQGSGQKAMVNVGTDVGSWYTYSDLSMSMPDSDIADDDQIDLVLGGRYNYGPGNIYVEVLLENLTDDEDVETNDEFSQSIDLTMDYYF